MCCGRVTSPAGNLFISSPLSWIEKGPRQTGHIGWDKPGVMRNQEEASTMFETCCRSGYPSRGTRIAKRLMIQYSGVGLNRDVILAVPEASFRLLRLSACYRVSRASCMRVTRLSWMTCRHEYLSSQHHNKPTYMAGQAEKVVCSFPDVGTDRPIPQSDVKLSCGTTLPSAPRSHHPSRAPGTRTS